MAFRSSAAISRALTADPRVVPYPGGTVGEYAYYDRSGRREWHGLDTSGQWVPSGYADRVFEPPVDTQPLYFFLADDVDADESLSSAYSDLTQIATWKNKGGSGGNFTGATGNNASAQPTLIKPWLNGRMGVYFENTGAGASASSYMTASGSASVFTQPWTTAAGWELFLLLTPLSSLTNRYFGNGESGSENRLEIFSNSSNAMNVAIGSTGGTVCSFAGPTIVIGQTYLFNVHGNGSTVKCSIDGGVTETSSGAVSNLVASANGARDFILGGVNVGGTATPGASIVGFACIYGSELTANQRRRFFTEPKRLYHHD